MQAGGSHTRSGSPPPRCPCRVYGKVIGGRGMPRHARQTGLPRAGCRHARPPHNQQRMRRWP
eukprot:3232659-Prymnesium_polylepis.1